MMLRAELLLQNNGPLLMTKMHLQNNTMVDFQPF